MSSTASANSVEKSNSYESSSWNISLITNVVAAAIFSISYIMPFFSDQFRAVGLFALSGALTNWLAVHMLFERVPGLYGSGIIVIRFKEFKTSIYTLIMNQFFSATNLEKFFQSSFDGANKKKIFEEIGNGLDYDLLYNKLVSALIESPLGGMLSMVGGVNFLEPAKPQLVSKMQQTIKDMIEEESFTGMVQDKLNENINPDFVRSKVENIIKNRLDELTPIMVKDIIQDMIQEHLGWLVVWGGVFGGLIGLVASMV